MSFSDNPDPVKDVLVAECNALRAEVAQLRAESQWYPIDQAPKGSKWAGGVSILVTDGYSVDQVEWEWRYEFWHATGGKRKSGNFLNYEPTLFRPLPLPPKTEKTND